MRIIPKDCKVKLDLPKLKFDCSSAELVTKVRGYKRGACAADQLRRMVAIFVDFCGNMLVPLM